MTPGWFGPFIPSTLVTNVVIASGTERIGENAFLDRTALSDVIIPDSVKRIGANAFGNCHEDLYDTVTRPGLILVDGWVVGYDGAVLPDPFDLDLTGLRGIADGAFEGCLNLVHVTIPSNFTYIASRAFRNCINLAGVTLTEGVTEILPLAFSGCTALGGVSLPQSLPRPPFCREAKREPTGFRASARDLSPR